jgi:hypothetical protein
MGLNVTHTINRPLIKLRELLKLRGGALLCYPDFNKPGSIYLYTAGHQLGAVIMQGKKPMAFYLPKLNTAQMPSSIPGILFILQIT